MSSDPMLAPLYAKWLGEDNLRWLQREGCCSWNGFFRPGFSSERQNGIWAWPDPVAFPLLLPGVADLKSALQVSSLDLGKDFSRWFNSRAPRVLSIHSQVRRRLWTSCIHWMYPVLYRCWASKPNLESAGWEQEMGFSHWRNTISNALTCSECGGQIPRNSAPDSLWDWAFLHRSGYSSEAIKSF